MADAAVFAGAQARTQVFIIRIWHEPQEEGRSAVRIQARHVLSGETRYFVEWSALTGYLSGKLKTISHIPGE